MTYYIDKLHYLSEQELELSKEDKILFYDAIKALNNKNHDLDTRIDDAARILGKHENVSPVIIGAILAKFKFRNAGEFTEQTALIEIVKKCGISILDTHRKMDLHLPFKSPLKFTDRNITAIDVIQRLSGNNMVAAILIAIENGEITSLDDLKKTCLPQSNGYNPYINDYGRFQIALRFLNKTDGSSASYIFDKILGKLGTFSAIHKLHLEWALLQMGGLPRLREWDANFGEKQSLTIVLRTLNALIYSDDTEEEELDELDLKNIEFLKKIPPRELFLIIGIVSEVEMLRRISENLDSILKGDKEATYHISLKIASVLCNFVNSGKILPTDLFSIISTCLKPEILPDGGPGNIVQFIKDSLQYKNNLEEIFKGLLQLGLKLPELIECLNKMPSKSFHELVRAFCKGGALERVEGSKKLSLMKERLKKHTDITPVLISEAIDDLELSLKEKASLAKHILTNIDKFKSIQNKKHLSCLVAFTDPKDIESIVQKAPKDLWEELGNIVIEKDLAHAKAFFNLLKKSQFDDFLIKSQIQNMIRTMIAKYPSTSLAALLAANNNQLEILKILSDIDSEIASQCLSTPTINPGLLLAIVQYYVERKHPFLEIFYHLLLNTEIEVENTYYQKGPQAAAMCKSYFASFDREQLDAFITVLGQAAPSYRRDDLLNNIKKQMGWRFLNS